MMRLLQKYHKTTIKRVLIRFLIVFMLIGLMIAYSYLLKVMDYRISNDKLDNKRQLIALITDLHGCYYGKNQAWLLDSLQEKQPTMILLGGDIYDDKIPFKHTDILLSQLSAIAPTYYVDGNHENWLDKANYHKAMTNIKSYGIEIIHGKQVMIPNTNIALYGLSDPHGQSFKDDWQKITAMANQEQFNILLTHRPEYIDDYLKYPFDLILAGHAHGGQWRVPFLINGVYAPNQGFLPKYAGGLYQFENKTLIVSRGLARESTRVPRIFNRPELVFIDVGK